jgi:hypothetical protein
MNVVAQRAKLNVQSGVSWHGDVGCSECFRIRLDTNSHQLLIVRAAQRSQKETKNRNRPYAPQQETVHRTQPSPLRQEFYHRWDAPKPRILGFAPARTLLLIP